MKPSKFSAQKFQMLIVLCFATAILNFPVWAQDTKPMEKFYCPCCGMSNLTTSKFCSACGAKLPDFASLLPVNGETLAVSSLGMQMSSASMSNDTLTATIFNEGRNEQWERQQGDVAGPIAAGLFAGVIGFFAGGFAGYGIDMASSDDYYNDYDGLMGFAIGAPIGESLLMPVGVHLANGRRGNLALSVLASAGIAGTGILLASATGDARILIPIPLVQLFTCLTIERATSR